MSFDSPADNQAWKEEEEFRFELWSDDDRELAVYYGAASSADQGAASRITVLLDPRGSVALEYLNDISVGTHPKEVLDDCRALYGGQ